MPEADGGLPEEQRDWMEVLEERRAALESISARVKELNRATGRIQRSHNQRNRESVPKYNREVAVCPRCGHDELATVRGKHDTSSNTNRAYGWVCRCGEEGGPDSMAWRDEGSISDHYSIPVGDMGGDARLATALEQAAERLADYARFDEFCEAGDYTHDLIEAIREAASRIGWSKRLTS